MPVLPKALGRLASPRKSWSPAQSPQSNQAALLTAPAGEGLSHMCCTCVQALLGGSLH